MVFKGTDSRSAFEIALALERVGGSLEAHTTKEYTCFYTRVLREHLDLALDVISDILLRPTHEPQDIKLEKGVVIEEINNVFDTPDDWIFEILSEKVYGEHPLARPILGTPDTVNSFTQQNLKNYMRQHYVGGNVIISVAGDIDTKVVFPKIERYFPFPAGTVPHATQGIAATQPGAHFQVDDKLMQQYLVMATRSMSYDDDDRFPLLLASTLLGGGMSSRLFQSVRERAGLCYAINTFSEFTRDGGISGTFMAVSPDHTEAAVDLVWREYEHLKSEGISKRELDDTRDQLKGSMLLGRENVASKMSRLAKNEMHYGRHIETTEILERLDAITLDDVHRMAETYWSRDKTLLVGLGPLEGL
jgi:predicted Zn-dependent peptidase